MMLQYDLEKHDTEFFEDILYCSVPFKFEFTSTKKITSASDIFPQKKHEPFIHKFYTK